MLRKVLRRLVGASAALPGGRRYLRRRCARSLAVLMYHGVTAEPPPVYNWNQLPAPAFEQHLELLSAEYTVLPLGEVLDRLAAGRPLPDHTACLTFDDGYRNVYTTAYPLLRRRQLPFSVFLVTDLVGTGRYTWQDQLFAAVAATSRPAVRFGGGAWELATAPQRAHAYRALVRPLKRMPVAEKDAALAPLLQFLGQPRPSEGSALAVLGWDEVRALRGDGLAEFGAHTHTHQLLSRCSPERQEEELRVSRQVIREHLGQCRLFAYPNGNFTGLTRDLLVRLGYRCGLTTVPGLARPGDDPYRWRRVCVGADISARQFALAMLGL